MRDPAVWTIPAFASMCSAELDRNGRHRSLMLVSTLGEEDCISVRGGRVGFISAPESFALRAMWDRICSVGEILQRVWKLAS